MNKPEDTVGRPDLISQFVIEVPVCIYSKEVIALQMLDIK